MCLAANVPLIESGTTGFNGQVQVIKRVRGLSATTLLNDCANCTIGRNRMLRLHAKSRAQVLPRMHHPKHTLATHPLHSMGQVVSVRRNLWHLGRRSARTRSQRRCRQRKRSREPAEGGTSAEAHSRFHGFPRLPTTGIRQGVQRGH